MGKKRRNHKNKKWLVVGLLSILLIALVIIFLSDGARRRVKQFADQNIPKPQAQTAEPAAAAEHRSVTLFFLSANDDLLHKEKRRIAAGPSIGEEAENVLRELIKGSEGGFVSPLPPQTRVRQVYVTDEGIAYVDFSRDLVDKFSYGSSAELAAVYAVVDSLAWNFKSIKKVVILVEGGEKETLGGHVDLSQPLLPDLKMVAD